MITMSAIGLIAMLVAVLLLGAWIAVRAQREITGSDGRVRRFMRDVDICDEAENGWSR